VWLEIARQKKGRRVEWRSRGRERLVELEVFNEKREGEREGGGGRGGGRKSGC